MKAFKLIATACLIFSATAASAGIISTSYDVHANQHVWNNGNGYAGNLGLDTGINFALGDSFEVTVDDIFDTWNFCVGGSVASCVVNADGVRPALNTILGTYNNSGYSFAFGTLVGRVGAGDFFSIGTTGFSGTADASGELVLFHWDHNTNNGGSIKASVSYAVPEPANIALILGAVGLAGLRRKQ